MILVSEIFSIFVFSLCYLVGVIGFLREVKIEFVYFVLRFGFGFLVDKCGESG